MRKKEWICKLVLSVGAALGCLLVVRGSITSPRIGPNNYRACSPLGWAHCKRWKTRVGSGPVRSAGGPVDSCQVVTYALLYYNNIGIVREQQ